MSGQTAVTSERARPRNPCGDFWAIVDALPAFVEDANIDGRKVH